MYVVSMEEVEPGLDFSHHANSTLKESIRVFIVYAYMAK